MIPVGPQYGLWAANLHPGERIARLRCLTAIAHLSCGPRGAELVALLRATEADEAAVPGALAALNRLAPLDRRRIVPTYAVLTGPVQQPSLTSKIEGRTC
ncbi:hypothetical protein FOHLNKBM_4447 [Methylobacterium longum]|nr:hypothetical protein FOHLNKBM_4447 [Methylobacterium longum]